MRRAAQHLLKNINPDQLKLRRAVYGGVTKDSFIHFMPAEIAKPVALYKNDGSRKWSYQPPQHWFSKGEDDKFSVASINGVRFLAVRHSEPGATLVIDDMDDITGMTGTATPAVNDHDFISGEAAVQATFDDTGKTLIRTMDDALDLTDYLRGTVLIPIRVAAEADVASITLRLRTDASNYYQVTTTADDIEDYLINGWNFLRFNMENRTTTGSPTVTNIVDWVLVITATTGDTVVCVIDRMTLQQNAPLWLEGYSNTLFLDGTTGAAKSDVSVDDDDVNIDEELADILHYELCLLVEQAGNSSKDGNSSSAFAAQLKRAYSTYYENHPSEELPMSYSILPQMNRSTEPSGAGGLLDDVWREIDTTS